MRALLDRWDTLYLPRDLGRRLLTAWSEPTRGYHDTLHLAEVLTAADALATEAHDLRAVRLALWFHDAVYDGVPGQDERRSADLAREMLFAHSEPLAEAVARLVLVTATHDPAADDPDGQVVSDADLWILSAPADRYADYTRQVRGEYARFDDATFAAGRAEVMQRLLDAPSVYRTRTARAWESAARANVGAEVSRLLASAAGARRPAAG